MQPQSIIPPGTVPFICQSCGIIFHRAKNRRPKFCSQRCHGQASVTPISMSAKAVRILCESCGTPFYRYQSASKGARFCQRACGAAFRAALIDSRIAAHIDTSNPTGCHPWTAGTDDDGYGKISYKGQPARVVRILFGRQTGVVLTSTDFICHTCDWPPCCRFDHLFKSNAAGNTADMVSKGRDYHGERHHRAKLTVPVVQEIRSRYAAGDVSQYALAKQYRITLQHMTRVIARKSWAHVP